MNQNEKSVIQAQIAAVEAGARANTAQALAQFEVAAALKRLITDPVPEPPPAPLPPPPAPLPPPPAPLPPPPPPVPTPPPAGTGVFTRALNPERTLIPRAWMADSLSYDRHPAPPPVIRSDTWRYEFRQANRLAGTEGWTSGSYVLVVDGTPTATSVTKPTGNVGAMWFNAAAVPDGWHMLDVAGTAGETCIPMFVYVWRDPKSSPPLLRPVVQQSWDEHGNPTRITYAWVPNVYQPRIVPLDLRTADHYSDTPGRVKMVMRHLVPMDSDDVYQPRITDGVVHQINSRLTGSAGRRPQDGSQATRSRRGGREDRSEAPAACARAGRRASRQPNPGARLRGAHGGHGERHRGVDGEHVQGRVRVVCRRCSSNGRAAAQHASQRGGPQRDDPRRERRRADAGPHDGQLNVVEPTPVQVTAEVKVEPTPVTIENTVEATLNMPPRESKTTVTYDDETGQIRESTTTETTVQLQ